MRPKIKVCNCEGQIRREKINEMINYTRIHDLKEKLLPELEQHASVLQIQSQLEEVDYEKRLLGYVEKALLQKRSNWLVLPEYSTNLSLEKEITLVMEQSKQNLVVIAGSYLYEGKNRVPILIKKHGKIRTYYQEKRHIAPDEKNVIPGTCRHLFVNTGLGDFAVLICYEAVDSRELSYMEQLVDILIVVACNPSNTKFHRKFEEYCHQAYLLIFYANQAVVAICDEEGKALNKGGNSAFYLPYRNREKRIQNCMPCGDEGLTTFSFNLHLLEQARDVSKRKSSVLHGTEWAAPLPHTNLHYSSDLSRKKHHWLKMIRDKEKKSIPESIKLYLYEWEAILKERNIWAIQRIRQKYFIPIVPFSIGQSKGNDLRLKNPQISSQHAKISMELDHFYLNDLESTNGTFSMVIEKTESILWELFAYQEVPLKSGDCFFLASKEDYFRVCFAESPKEMNVTLEQWQGENKICEQAINRFPFRITADLTQNKFNQKICADHVELIRSDEQLYLRDLGSNQGTYFLFARPIVKMSDKLNKCQHLLTSGDFFCVANQYIFSIEIVTSPSNSIDDSESIRTERQ